MRLANEDVILFYKLWLGLICFVNRKHNIDPELGEVTSPAGLDVKTLAPIKNKLWKEPGVIDEYIRDRWGTLSKEERDILTGWKNNRLSGEFVLIKHEKDYSVFMPVTNEEDTRLYGVIGIISPFAEMVPKEALPMMLNVVLLPFKGRIIFDSIFSGRNIRFGSGYKNSFGELYRDLKKQYGITSSLDVIPPTPIEPVPVKPAPVETDPVKPAPAETDPAKPDPAETAPAKAAPPARSRAKPANSKQKRRIKKEILVGASDKAEQFSAWHSHLQDKLNAPFKAFCSEKLTRSPLNKDEQVTVTALADMNDCCGDILVMISWKGRKFAVPLEQLRAIDANTDTVKAIEDWKIWVKSGHSI